MREFTDLVSNENFVNSSNANFSLGKFLVLTKMFLKSLGMLKRTRISPKFYTERKFS